MEGRIVQWQLRRKQRRKRRSTKSFAKKYTGDAMSVPEVFCRQNPPAVPPPEFPQITQGPRLALPRYAWSRSLGVNRAGNGSAEAEPFRNLSARSIVEVRARCFTAEAVQHDALRRKAKIGELRSPGQPGAAVPTQDCRRGLLSPHVRAKAAVAEGEISHICPRRILCRDELLACAGKCGAPRQMKIGELRSPGRGGAPSPHSHNHRMGNRRAALARDGAEPRPRTLITAGGGCCRCGRSIRRGPGR